MTQLPLALLVLGVALQSGASVPTEPEGSEVDLGAIGGTWLSEEGDAAIELSACDEGVCGEIVWLLEPTDDAGTLKHDINNPDPALRGRPIVGLRLLQGFQPDGPDRWTGGRIYDPNSGKSYRSKLELVGDGETLKVRGYVLTPLFGRSTRWSRTNLAELESLREPSSPAPRARD